MADLHLRADLFKFSKKGMDFFGYFVYFIGVTDEVLRMSNHKCQEMLTLSPLPEDELAIAQLEQLLSKGIPRLIGTNDQEIPLPPQVFEMLHKIIQCMVSGQVLHLIPAEQEMTTQQAADLLNVSRPFLVKELEKGEIPFRAVGSHRRVQFKDVMAYKNCRDQKRRRILDDLTALGQKLGLYDFEDTP